MDIIKSSLISDIELAEQMAQYDTNAKKILSNKEILAWILRDCVDEFQGMSISEIIPCIEDKPSVGTEPVMPGMQGRIFGGNTEDKVPNEGVVYFDILFHASAPLKPPVKVYINLEAQRDIHPGYDLVSRGIFYCARLLSKQYDVEFTSPDYDRIKKVYSIWVCMNAPKNLQNTISAYRVRHEVVWGEFKDNSRCDLLETVLIRLGEGKRGSRLLQMLNILFGNLEPEEKEKRLANDLGVQSAAAMKGWLDHMCNFSVGILEKGIEQGIEQGIEKGRIKTLWNLYQDGDLTLSRAAEKAGMTEEVFLSAGADLNEETAKSMA